jgi:hypothetical protein
MTCGLYYKSIMIVIYNHNDNGLYCKTTIVTNLTTIIANLALARSVNYDHKVRCKLKRTFTIINYDPKPFIVQTTGVKEMTTYQQDYCMKWTDSIGEESGWSSASSRHLAQLFFGASSRN